MRRQILVLITPSVALNIHERTDEHFCESVSLKVRSDKGTRGFDFGEWMLRRNDKDVGFRANALRPKIRRYGRIRTDDEVDHADSPC